MSEHESKQPAKTEDNAKRRKRKPLEYQRFERLLKMAVRTPPMRKANGGNDGQDHEASDQAGFRT